jgi:hypothetical protein
MMDIQQQLAVCGPYYTKPPPQRVMAAKVHKAEGLK